MRLQKGTDYPPFGMNELERNFEVQNIICSYDTISASIFAIDDNFSSCNGSWTATASATVLCTNSQLQIFNTSTSSKNIGAIKTFTGGTGQHSVSFRLDDNICKNYVVWPPSNSPKPITVYIRDAANNVVASQNYTSTGNNTIFSFTYTPASAGTHTMEFYMANATALCYFFINDVTVQYDSVRVDTICEDLGAGYRFHWNTQERVPEIQKEHQTALFWEYDPRVVLRWNTDPKSVAWESPYVINRNNPILYNDPNGDVGNLVVVNNANGGGTVFVVATYYTIKGEVVKNGFNAMQMADIKNIETTLNGQNHRVTEDINYNGQNLNGYSVQFVLNIKEVDAIVDVNPNSTYITQTINVPTERGITSLSPNNSLANYSPEAFKELKNIEEVAGKHNGKLNKIGGITDKENLRIAKQDGVIAYENVGATFSSNVLHEMFHTWGVDKDKADIKDNSIGTGSPVPNPDDINQTVKTLIKSGKAHNGTGKPEKQ